MAEASRHDAWAVAASYDAFMGRWSRRIAPGLVARIAAGADRDWLDVGCGTGSLAGAILAAGRPRSVVGVDPSADFVAAAAAALPDPRASFRVGGAEALPLADASRDVAASLLVLNFVPDRARALAEMRRVVRPGGRVGFAVWDYPGRGVGFLAAFWEAAGARDPAAAALDESRRFGFCTPAALAGLAEDAGLSPVACAPLEAEAVFANFDDLWRPFTLGAGPAPGYCASLSAEAREALRGALAAQVRPAADGTIALGLRAWAVTARVP